MSRAKEAVCPDCGGKLKNNTSGKWFCDNRKCPVIFVQPGRGYKGSDVVVRDAVIVNDKKIQGILRVAGR